MSECEKCGREDGHHLGCPASSFWADADRLVDGEKATGAICAYGDCENPPRPKGKGPAPKYCEEHSDPKNRK